MLEIKPFARSVVIHCTCLGKHISLVPKHSSRVPFLKSIVSNNRALSLDTVRTRIGEVGIIVSFHLYLISIASPYIQFVLAFKSNISIRHFIIFVEGHSEGHEKHHKVACSYKNIRYFNSILPSFYKLMEFYCYQFDNCLGKLDQIIFS